MNEDIKQSKDQLEEESKPIQSEVIDVKNNEINTNETNEKNKDKKRKKGIAELKSMELDNQQEEFNIYARGTIENALKHRSASRPRKYIEELTEEEEKIHVCKCCDLPEVVENKIEYFKIGDSPTEFSNCGMGVVLYYEFIKFVIMVSFVASIGIGCINIYFSYQYTNEMNKICNNYYHEKLETNANDFSLVDKCKFYMTDASDGEYNTKKVDTFFFTFSSVNIKDYRKIFNELYPSNSDEIESTLINVSLVSFITFIIIFIFNLFYIFFLFNKGNAVDYLVFTVSDYAVFLTNLYDMFNKFKANLNNIKAMEESNEPITEQKYDEELGFKPTENMSELDKFKHFLIEKLFKETKEVKEKIGEEVITKKEIIKAYDVNKVDCCYKSEEIIKIKGRLDEIEDSINKIEFNPSIKKENKKLGLEGPERYFFSYFYVLPLIPLTFLCPKKVKLQELNKEKEELEEKMNKLIQDSKEKSSEYFGGAAFITFNTTKEQEDYLSKLPNNFFDYVIVSIKNMAYIFCSCCVNKKKSSYFKNSVTFEAAPEPEDVIFENVEVKPIMRIFYTSIVFLISIILCGVSFAAIYGLNLLQSNVDENQKNHTTHVVLLYVISFAITIVTSVMDIVFEIILEILTKIERQTTWTHFYLSYSIKLTFFQFVNSAILPTFSEFFINKSEGYEILISNMLMKFIVNALVTPGMWTLSIGYFKKKILIYLCIERKRKKNEEINYSQKELNDVYEYPPMNVSAKYSYFAKTILMSFFYIPIFPLGIIISFCGFMLAYWLEKYNFAHMYKTPEMLNRQISEFYANYFVLSFFVYGIGDYVFLNNAYDSNTWSLVNIIFFGVLIIFPYHRMLTFDFFQIDESLLHEDKNYKEKYTEFPNDYERANPMTESEGKIRYLNAKKEKGEINEEEFNEEKKEIENETPINAFTYKGHYRGPPRFYNSGQGEGSFPGKGHRFRGKFRFRHGPHGPHGFHGPHFPHGIHGPHWGPHFGRMPHDGFEYPPHGFGPQNAEYEIYNNRRVNNVINEDVNLPSSANFKQN